MVEKLTFMGTVAQFDDWEEVLEFTKHIVAQGTEAGLDPEFVKDAEKFLGEGVEDGLWEAEEAQL